MSYGSRFTSSEWALIAAAGILAVGFAITGAIGGDAFYKVHALSNTLSVTGSATATTTADTATWTVTVTRTAYESDIASAQTRVTSDAQTVENFMTQGGIAAANVSESPMAVDRDYSNSNQNAPVSYDVHEDVSITSNDPRLVEKLSRDISSLLSRGVLFSAQAPQYFISSLPDLRISLIGKAVADAKARANEIAKSTGQSVGPLQSASGGVVQVMSPNSVDVSDYGSYDTSTIDKQVMVTAHATFLIQ